MCDEHSRWWVGIYRRRIITWHFIWPPPSILIKLVFVRCRCHSPVSVLPPPGPPLFYCTIMCGAESSTVTVAMIVKSVKTIKQNRSTTIAANFQSLIKSCSSSRFFMRPVMNCSSFRIKCRSLCEHPLIECSSTVVGRLNLERRKGGFDFFLFSFFFTSLTDNK